MNTSNLIVIAIVVAIVLFVSVYLWKAKKSGAKCIGCPDGKACTGSCSVNGDGCTGCSGGCCGSAEGYFNK